VVVDTILRCETTRAKCN